MNEFKKKRLTKEPPLSKRPPPPPPKAPKPKPEKPPADPTSWKHRTARFVQRHFIWTAILVLGFTAMVKASYNIITLAENVSVKEIVLSMFSEKIVMDENNHTNIVLLGTGGLDHDGGTLTDTIMVVSLDHTNHYVSILSIPRDLYVEVEELYGSNRVNSIAELYAEQLIYNEGMEETAAYQAGYELTKDTLSEILNIPIHYYAQVDFHGFVDIVDALGGIDVDVENSIYDPFYPAEDGSIDYQTFSIEAGPQHLDGSTALKYVRSRKTTSDFDRAARQQQVIQAIKDKALSLGVLANPSRLQDIYSAVQNNFETDLQWSEMVYLAKIAEKFETENMSSWVLNDNPLSPGGFLYTPERELYGGAFVLIPYVSDFSEIQAFADLVLNHPEVHANPLTYQVLNGTKTNGVATETMYYLIRYGFDVVRYGNAANRETLVTRMIPVSHLLAGQTGEATPELPELEGLIEHLLPIGFVMTELPAEYSPTEWETEADVILELGQDYVDWMTANPKHFY